MDSEHEHLNKSCQDGASLKVAEIAIRNAYDASQYAYLNRCQRKLAGIADVHLGT
jgi:hypothetical protein